MVKGAAIVLVAAVAAYLLLGRSGDGTAVISCLEKAGATVQRSSPNFKRAFPYMLALGSGERVQSYPELDDARAYGVRFVRGEALLFFAHDSDDAASIEQVLVGFGARGGVTVPARRADKVLLVWTVPVASSLSYPLDSCIE